jgi:hypothetical protein
MNEELKAGDVIWASNDFEGPALIQVLEVHEDIGEFCGLIGPGFFGVVILDEYGTIVAEEAVEMCFTMNQIMTTQERVTQLSVVV